MDEWWLIDSDDLIKPIADPVIEKVSTNRIKICVYNGGSLNSFSLTILRVLAKLQVADIFSSIDSFYKFTKQI